MRHLYAYVGYESTQRLVEDGMSKNSQIRAHCSWILCSVSRARLKTMHSLFCIALPYNLLLHRFEIHSAVELWRAALLGSLLAASRLPEAARWQ